MPTLFGQDYLLSDLAIPIAFPAFIVVLAVVTIGFTVLVNESVGIHIAESQSVRYTGLVHWFLILLLHSWSYKVQSPVSVLASVSYVLSKSSTMKKRVPALEEESINEQ